jgi:multidrug efflux pump subunit AcrB
MRLLGQTFNLMTLGAMAIAIGLVIDDAVVVTENIVRHLHLTSDRTIAVREAVQELLWPVTSSTLTTVVVFLPLGLLEGVAGQFFSALSLTLTIAVLVSLVLALTIIPLLAERFLTDADAVSAAAPRKSNRRSLSDRYARALGGILHHVRAALVVAAVLVAAGLGAWRLVGSGFLPDMDEGSFIIDYWTPGGTALAETDRQLHIIEQILAATPEISGTSRRTGAELGLFATEQNTGDIVARLVAPSRRDRDIFEIMDDVRGRIETAVPRVRVEFVQILSDVLDDLSGAAHPLEIKLFGSDLAALERYAGVLAPEVEQVAGLDDFFGGLAEPSAEMAMTIRGVDAARRGMTPKQVSEAVSGAASGSARRGDPARRPLNRSAGAGAGRSPLQRRATRLSAHSRAGRRHPGAPGCPGGLPHRRRPERAPPRKPAAADRPDGGCGRAGFERGDARRARHPAAPSRTGRGSASSWAGVTLRSGPRFARCCWCWDSRS